MNFFLRRQVYIRVGKEEKVVTMICSQQFRVSIGIFYGIACRIEHFALLGKRLLQCREVQEFMVHFMHSYIEYLKLQFLSLFGVLKDVCITVIKWYFILLLQCNDISENPGPKMLSKIVQGIFSQGNSKFSASAGLQCFAIALYAGAFSCLKQMSGRTSETLDRIVEGGDNLFISFNWQKQISGC